MRRRGGHGELNGAEDDGEKGRKETSKEKRREASAASVVSFTLPISQEPSLACGCDIKKQVFPAPSLFLSSTPALSLSVFLALARTREDKREPT